MGEYRACMDPSNLMALYIYCGVLQLSQQVVKEQQQNFGREGMTFKEESPVVWAGLVYTKIALGHLLGMYVTKAPPRFSSYAIVACQGKGVSSKNHLLATQTNDPNTRLARKEDYN